MIKMPAEFSESTRGIMSEIDMLTFNEKSTVLNLVSIMAAYPDSPEEGLSIIMNEARSIFSRFAGNERELNSCIAECFLALACECEVKAI